KAFACTYFFRYQMYLTDNYFNGTSDPSERGFVLHHEYEHWYGKGEFDAYSNTWPDKRSFGWGKTVSPSSFWIDMTTLTRDNTRALPFGNGIVTTEEWEYAQGIKKGPI